MKLTQEDYTKYREKISKEGFVKLKNPFGRNIYQKIAREGTLKFTEAKHACGNKDLAYSSRLTGLGPEAERFLNSIEVRVFLSEIFNQNYKVNADTSCYTYYQTNDFLSPHKDGDEGCDITLLFYFLSEYSKTITPSPGMYLQVFKDASHSFGELQVSHFTEAEYIIVGKGSKWWHGRSVLRDEERVGMVTACFIKDSG